MYRYLYYYFNMAIKIKLPKKLLKLGLSKVFSYKSLVACTIFLCAMIFQTIYYDRLLIKPLSFVACYSEIKRKEVRTNWDIV